MCTWATCFLLMNAHWYSMQVKVNCHMHLIQDVTYMIVHAARGVINSRELQFIAQVFQAKEEVAW